MGDGLKLSKDKRHRSSSSLTGAILDGTRSDRKLDKNASIPEIDDQFTTAEARCDDLQEKIELIKSLKRKRKLKKRSITRITEPVTTDNVPFISVRTQPKKKVSQQAARIRRLEVPPNPTRGYLDPATVEQHRMIGQVRGYNQAFKQPQQERTGHLPSSAGQRLQTKVRRQHSQADGDSLRYENGEDPIEVACGQDEFGAEYSNYDMYNCPPEYSVVNSKKTADQTSSCRKNAPRDVLSNEDETTDQWRSTTGGLPMPRRRQAFNKNHQSKSVAVTGSRQTDDRPVVELFNKSRLCPINVRPLTVTSSPPPLTKKNKKGRIPLKFDDQVTRPHESSTEIEPKQDNHHRHPRRVKYRSRRYELPTVASQMKQAGMRYYCGSSSYTSNHTNIPFVVSKSTAPSHNIGVNIQQVLNGLKIQQPLSGIPLTIAHHMGLGHVPTSGTKSATVQPSLDNREINVIRIGQRLLRLPSYKYMSYNRLLNLYREGDGMVPRFLRAISRPHYFYTSMYNLAMNREDFDGATSKGRGGSQEAKQSLAEYASLYREYEHIDKCIKESNYEPELERRRDELTKELAAREEHIRRVVQEFRSGGEVEQTLRASASTAEEGYRHSTFMLGDPQQ